MSLVPGLKAGISVAEALHLVSQSFRLAQLDSPGVDARLLIGHALRLGRAQLITQSDRLLEAREVKTIDALSKRRLRHEPVARIVGRKGFWNLDLQITPAVLVPRPETETVVEAVLDAVNESGLRMERLRILDIGTGSGALLLALLGELTRATGIGTDISHEALTVARANAVGHRLDQRCRFVVCDIAKGIEGPFDIIVSNPPYIASADIATLAAEVRDHDPLPALDGGNDGLNAYRAIAQDARRLLAPGGKLVVELGAGQEALVRALFTKSGLTVGAARPDLAGIARALAVTAS